jgi:hypothetical protein
MASQAAFEGELEQERRNPALFLFTALPFVACLLGVAFFDKHLLALSPHALALSAGLSAAGWQRHWMTSREKVKVRVTAKRVDIGGRRVPREQIEAGFVSPGTFPKLILRRRGLLPQIELTAADVTEARAVLRALGLDASQSVASFHVQSKALTEPSLVYPIAIALGVVFALLRQGMGSAALQASALLAGLAGAFLFLSRTHVDVGADGVSVTWLGRSRFVGYDQIACVTSFERGSGRSQRNGIVLTLKDQGELRVGVAGGGITEGCNTLLLEERIQQSLEAFRKGGAEADAALLRRGGRDIAAWIIALRSLGAGANADMRTAPMPRERLFRIVEDPSSAPPDRAAAAIALAPDLDDEGRARLRGAASATAGSRLRIAIEAAADAAPEDDVQAALEALEAEHAPRRAET